MADCGLRNWPPGFEAGGQNPQSTIPNPQWGRGMNRRETVKVLAAGVGFWLTPLQVQRAADFAAKARSAGRGYESKLFTPHEWETARVPAHLLIPRRGGSRAPTDDVAPG